MTNKINEPFTKEALKAVLRMKKSKFIIHMNELEPDLLANFPRYNKRCSILPENVFKWIYEEYGLTEEQVIQRLILHYKIENHADIKKIYATFGIQKP